MGWLTEVCCWALAAVPVGYLAASIGYWAADRKKQP